MRDKTTDQQWLRNPDVPPTNENIAQGLGTANNAYVKFISTLKSHGIQIEWRYYTDGNAWLGKGLYQRTGVRGGTTEITAFWLSIWDGFFRVTIFVPEKVRADALSLPLDDETRQMIVDSKQMGKLKFFPLVFNLHSDVLFDAVFALIDFRKMIK